MISLTSLMNKANTLAFKDFAACILVMSCIPQQRTGGGEKCITLHQCAGLSSAFPEKTIGDQRETRRRRERGGRVFGGGKSCTHIQNIYNIHYRHVAGRSYLWWLHLQHQTSGLADHSSRSTPSPVPHRWRVHVAIHLLPCNSWWKLGRENEGNRILRGVN